MSFLAEFPGDFNGVSLKNKVGENATKCVSKYRAKIYTAFNNTRNNFIEVLLDNDYNGHIDYLLKKEFHDLGLTSEIVERAEEFLCGGENDPEYEEILQRYLIIKPL